MIAANCLLVFAFLVQQPVQTKTYNNLDLDLSFKYPENWRLSVKRGDAKFTIPLKTGSAVLEVMTSTFRGSLQDWSDYQDYMNKTEHHTVEKHWQEEILGVPLVLTKMKYQQGAEYVASLTGLLYQARAKKMVFRLTSPENQYDEAELAFRGALETLQTASGHLPRPDDPNKPLPEEALKPINSTKPPVVLTGGSSGGKVKLAAQKVATQAGGVDVILRIPNGWSAAKSDLVFALKNNRFQGQLEITVNSELDSPKPEAALIAAAAESLKQFQSVVLREEPPPSRNRAGAKVSFVRRKGKAELGDFVVWQAVGAKEGYYWQLMYRGTLANFNKDRGLIEDLLDSASVEIVK